MSFTNQKPRVATEGEIEGFSKWGKFACYLCGHKFQPGDIWRWVYSAGRTIIINGKRWGLMNFKVCASCDGEDVLDRWAAANEEVHRRFFWFREE